MNNTQIQTTLAPLIAFAAGLLAGKGVFGLDAASWTMILGGAVAFAATVWGAVITSKNAMVTQVANMPEVKSVQLDAKSPNAEAVAASTPANVTIALKG